VISVAAYIDDDKRTFFRTAAILGGGEWSSIREWVCAMERARREEEARPPPFVGPLQLEIEAGHRPTAAERAAEQLARERAAESRHFLDTTFGDMQRVIAAAAQMQLKLPKMSERAFARVPRHAIA
jgi:hypothetical protein